MVIIREDCIFASGFCTWYITVSLTLMFFTDELLFHLNRYINAQNNRYWSSINLRHFLNALSCHMTGVSCAITAT
jgi:hypothetical protein